jgi:hypothetical protein
MKRDDLLNKIETRLGKMEETLIRNTISLEEHMRRTEILEKEIIPLRRQANIIDGASKIIVSLVALLVAARKLDIF